MRNFFWKSEKLQEVVIRKLTKWRPLARRLPSCRHAQENCSLSPITRVSCIVISFIGLIISFSLHEYMFHIEFSDEMFISNAKAMKIREC